MLLLYILAELIAREQVEVLVMYNEVFRYLITYVMFAV